MAPSLEMSSPSGSALSAAAQWIEGALLGNFGTALAVIAVAWVGFEMLSGRVSPRRSAQVVLGMFILFGAPRIASELAGLAQSQTPALTAQAGPAPNPPRPKVPSGYDPYAGAAVPNGL